MLPSRVTSQTLALHLMLMQLKMARKSDTVKADAGLCVNFAAQSVRGPLRSRKKDANNQLGDRASVRLNNEKLQQALQALPPNAASALAHGQQSAAIVGRLGQLVDGDAPLQSFLEQLLPELCGLFGGEAAVIWMRAEGASGAVFGVRYKMDNVLPSLGEQKKHERLVQLAWQQRQPLIAESASRKSPGADAERTPPDELSTQSPVENRDAQTRSAVRRSPTDPGQNPTRHPLLFGPILHLQQPIALLEVVLAEEQSPLAAEKRRLYLRGIQLVAERVYGGLRRRMTLPAATSKLASEHLDLLTNEVERLQQEIVKQIETKLLSFGGWAFASLADNQAFAKMVHQLLDSHGLRVACPECGNPAILRCLRAGNAKHGAFVFDHYLDTGRTFHGGSTTVPVLHVVKEPARRTAAKSSA